jgi:hypothetical protein
MRESNRGDDGHDDARACGPSQSKKRCSCQPCARLAGDRLSTERASCELTMQPELIARMCCQRIVCHQLLGVFP